VNSDFGKTWKEEVLMYSVSLFQKKRERIVNELMPAHPVSRQRLELGIT
jgi:hypothetical protein